MRVLDLFSGIGGFSLGLERAGMRTVAFCEIEPFRRSVLKKHWPRVHCFDDIRKLDARRLANCGIAVDVICGGFPCQDISSAGAGAGLAGERSGLWAEYARLIGEIRPRYVIVENVSMLLGRGLGTVLGDLAAIGYDAEWHCIPASYVGAPHQRDRVWIVAYPDRNRKHALAVDAEMASASTPSDADQARLSDHEGRPGSAQDRRHESASAVPDIRKHHWLSKPPVVRVVHGVSKDVDAVGALGDSVVPQIPEIIGRAIMRVQRNANTAQAR